MENSNTLPLGTVSADKPFHLPDGAGLEAELFDAIISSPSIFSFKDFCTRYILRRYNQQQISKALQSLQNKKFISHNGQFNSIKLHLQSVFPHSTPQISDHWIG